MKNGILIAALCLSALAVGYTLGTSEAKRVEDLEALVNNHSRYINDVGYLGDENKAKIDKHSQYINDIGYAVDKAHERINGYHNK
jgi:hypothetical protein